MLSLSDHPVSLSDWPVGPHYTMMMAPIVWWKQQWWQQQCWNNKFGCISNDHRCLVQVCRLQWHRTGCCGWPVQTLGGSLVVWPVILFQNSRGNKAVADLSFNDQLPGIDEFLFAILMGSMYPDWMQWCVCTHENTLKCTYQCVTYVQKYYKPGNMEKRNMAQILALFE